MEGDEIEKPQNPSEREEPLSYRASIKDPSYEYYSRRSLLWGL